MYMNFIKCDNPIFSLKIGNPFFCIQVCFFLFCDWNPTVFVMPTLSSLVALQIAISSVATTFGANSDEVGIELSVLNGYI